MPNPDGSMTAAEAVAALGAVGSSSSSTLPTPQPIGVPAYVRDPNTGATVPFTTRVRSTEDDLRTGNRGLRPTQQIQTTAQQPPRYYDGAELEPGTMSPDGIASLQRALITAGLIDKKANIRIGVWDVTSQKGFASLLAYANTTGLEWKEALDAYGQGQPTDDGSGRAPLQIRQTDPGELEQVFRKAVIDTLGTGWDEGKLKQMVASYQQVQATAQTEAYNQQETGGTVTEPPSAASFAMQQAKEQDPSGAQAHDFVGQSNNFFSMLKGVV